MAEPKSPVDELRRSLRLLWGVAPETTRGPRPGLTVGGIVDAAIALADAEGLPALSMRNLAAALGVGTMTLYRYLPGRAELLALMLDRVYGEGLERGDPEGDWRERVTAAARGEWAMYQRHPWVLGIEQGRPLLGPRSMDATEVAMRNLAGTGLPVREMLSVVLLVSSFVAGLARTTIEATQAAATTGITDEEWWNTHGEIVPFADDRHPLLNAAGEAGAWGESASTHDLEYGIARILDGVAARIASTTEASPR